MISLIVGTLGREAPLKRLLTSLEQQTFRDFEVVLIDQSGDDRLVPLLTEYPSLTIRRVTATPGLSKARNLGLTLARGDIVGFPDDDCWYGQNLLAHVNDALADTSIDGVSFRVQDEHGRCSAGGWMSAGRMTITRRNVWRTVVSCSFFLKRSVIGTKRFNEHLGIGSGTPFGSGEETDFLLYLLAQGLSISYDGSMQVFHPVFQGPWKLRRGWNYGLGHGWVLRHHHYGILAIGKAMAFQGIRALQAVFTFRFRKAVFHLVQACGRGVGYMLAHPSDTEKAAKTFGLYRWGAWGVSAILAVAGLALTTLWVGVQADVLYRYAPMAEAFAEGNWLEAFHPRFGVGMPTVAGSLVWLIGCDGLTACAWVALIAWALCVPPLFAVAERVFGRATAWMATLLYAICPMTFYWALCGLREPFRTLGVLCAILAILRRREGMRWGSLWPLLAALPALCVFRSDTLAIGGALLLAYGLYDRLGARFLLAMLWMAAWLQPGCLLTWKWLGQWLPSTQIAGVWLRLFGGTP